MIQLVTGRSMSSFYDEQRGTTDVKLSELARRDKEKKAAARAEKRKVTDSAPLLPAMLWLSSISHSLASIT